MGVPRPQITDLQWGDSQPVVIDGRLTITLDTTIMSIVEVCYRARFVPLLRPSGLLGT